MLIGRLWRRKGFWTPASQHLDRHPRLGLSLCLCRGAFGFASLPHDWLVPALKLITRNFKTFDGTHPGGPISFLFSLGHLLYELFIKVPQTWLRWKRAEASPRKTMSWSRWSNSLRRASSTHLGQTSKDLNQARTSHGGSVPKVTPKMVRLVFWLPLRGLVAGRCLLSALTWLYKKLFITQPEKKTNINIQLPTEAGALSHLAHVWKVNKNKSAPCQWNEVRGKWVCSIWCLLIPPPDLHFTSCHLYAAKCQTVLFVMPTNVCSHLWVYLYLYICTFGFCFFVILLKKTFAVCEVVFLQPGGGTVGLWVTWRATLVMLVAVWPSKQKATSPVSSFSPSSFQVTISHRNKVNNVWEMLDIFEAVVVTHC